METSFFGAAFMCFAMQHFLRVDGNAEIDTANYRLVRTLLENGYDKSIRPVNDFHTVTNVTFNPALHSIVGTHEAEESIVLKMWVRMLWNDEHLRWNPNDYGGINQLLLPVSSMWSPDYTILNMIDQVIVVPDEQNYVIIQPNGDAVVSIDQIITAHCKYHTVDFPFDTQNCTVELVSWMHTGDAIDLHAKFPTDLISYKMHAEWDLLSYSARRIETIYGASPIPFVEVYYDIVIQRKPGYYVTTFILPSFIIVTLSLVGLFSPFNDAGDREERVSMGLTTLLTMAIVLLIITDQMPKSSEGMPMLGYYTLVQIVLSAVATVMSVVVMYAHGLWWTRGRPVPNWLLRATLLHKYAVTTSKTKEDRSTSIDETKHEEKRPTSPDSSVQSGTLSSGCRSRSSGKSCGCLSCKMKSENMQVGEIAARLRQITGHLRGKTDDEERRHQWSRVGRRLDWLFMAVFNCIHLGFTLDILIRGYGKLTDKVYENGT